MIKAESRAQKAEVTADFDVLSYAAEQANGFLRALPDRPVHVTATREQLRAQLAVPLADEGRDADEVLRALVRGVERGLMPTAGPRYFGFVLGGTFPVSIAADWLTSAWDQHGTFYASSPASSVCEDAVAEWLVDLFGLPATASTGFPTGCQMANFTALAAARHAMLRTRGWDVERNGLIGAPPLEIVAGEESHVTIFAALRMLGFGTAGVHIVPADDQGRMRASALETTLRGLSAPAIVCAQAGNVNTGAFDPIEDIAAIVHRYRGWLHVDGAFGLWAAASPSRRHLARGIGEADSWATDAHKWLNVPYDSGIVFVRDADAHRASMTLTATYLQQTAGRERDGIDWVPDASRRARSFVLWATLQTLGRRGVAELVDRCCDLASLMARLLVKEPGVTIANDVVLNQVLVRVAAPPNRDPDAFTRDVAARIQASGVCWLGTTRWKAAPAMRISISSWMTTEEDIERSARAIIEAYREAERAS